MAYEALALQPARADLPFVSNIDGTDLRRATRDLDAEETTVHHRSKTFTTLR